MDNRIDLKIPVEFEKLSEYQVEDTRFIPVKIWILHTGLNLNNSIFNKNTVESAIPTLANTPILGYIEKNKNGEDDFSDHRSQIEVTANEIKIAYKCMAIGVVPETNNAQFEKKLCNDGVEREFLTANALIWTKWDSPLDIFNRDLYKDQSMELSDEYSGHFDENNHFIFDNFKFNGCCVLGGGVIPAMTGACVEINYSINDIQAKLNQFSLFMSQSSTTDVEVDIKNSEEGGTQVEEEIKVEPVAENSEGTVAKTFSENGQSNAEPETNTITSFSATYNQKREALNNALDSNVVKDDNGDIVSETGYWVEDFDDEYVYVEKYFWTNSDSNYTHGRFIYSYDEENNIATISGEFEEMYLVRLTKEEKDKIDTERNNFEVISQEFEIYKQNYSTENSKVEELLEYQKTKMDQERKIAEDTIFAKFEKRIGNTIEYSELIKNKTDYSLVDLEKECIYIVGLHTEETKFEEHTESKESIKFSVEREEESKGKYADLFEKYLPNK